MYGLWTTVCDQGNIASADQGNEATAGESIEHKTDDVAATAEPVQIASEREEAHSEQDKVSSAMDEETAKDIMAAPGVLMSVPCYRSTD